MNTEVAQSPADFRAELMKHAPISEPSTQEFVQETPVQETPNEVTFQPEGEMQSEQSELREELKNKFEDNKVPQSRFSEEVQKRREVEARFEEERIARIRLEAQLEAMRPREMEQRVESNIDPLDSESHNYLEEKINNIARENAELKQYLASQAESNKMTSYIENQEKAFSIATPDYSDAINHLKNVERQNASLLYSNEQDVSNFIGSKYNTIVKDSIAAGKNPSEVLYNMAKGYGYSPKAQAHKTDLGQLQSNMNKSATVPTGYSPPVSAGVKTFEQTLQPNGKVDARLFREALAQAGRNL